MSKENLINALNLILNSDEEGNNKGVEGLLTKRVTQYAEDLQGGKNADNSYLVSGNTQNLILSGEGYMAWDKQDKVLLKVDSLHLPLNSPSWKDITVETENGLEWKGSGEVVLLRVSELDASKLN